ncbi:MAG: M23 family metallopeptidase [Gammaproteobacteria bacterium]|nr:M23 family metallopeptidase [Gammaproteobacteria bacterium]
MNVIVFLRRAGRAHQIDFARPLTFIVTAAAALGVLGTAFAFGLQLGRQSGGHLPGDITGWSRTMADQRAEVGRLKTQLQDRIDALALRVGGLDAQLLRLDALGKRLTQMANIDGREFNFDAPPPTGGPEEEGGRSAEVPDLTALIGRVEDRIDLRGAQLAALENVILARELSQQIQPEGRPLRTGFISSHFGDRQDPFTGHEAFHRGVDFAGQVGSQVIAVATGIVTWAGWRAGYGELIEIAHGNGYVTRYGHNQKNLVTVGQTVTRGEPIAVIGSTGRSTGPHVHFEVLREGRQVDPLSFIGR